MNCVKFTCDTQRKFQIKGKGRATQRGLHFLHEALDDRLTVSEEIDRSNPLISLVNPYEALVGEFVAATNLGNS